MQIHNTLRGTPMALTGSKAVLGWMRPWQLSKFYPVSNAVSTIFTPKVYPYTGDTIRVWQNMFKVGKNGQ